MTMSFESSRIGFCVSRPSSVTDLW